jgi:hypothetical protein
MRVTIEKKTDQINFEDFLGGVERTVTITGVKKGTKEQQYDIELEGTQLVWRPAVTVLKLLVQAWGDDATQWIGRRAVLYGDPGVTFGKERVGGIRVKALSHIGDAPLTVALTITRGKRAPITVQPLAETPARDWLVELEQARGDVDLLGGLGVAAKQAGADDDTLTAIRTAYQEAKASNG